MSNKMERWKRLSATAVTSENDNQTSQNKMTVLTELSSMPADARAVPEENAVEENQGGTEKGNTGSTDNSVVEDKSISNTPTPTRRNKNKGEGRKKKESSEQVDSFASKVSNNVKSIIESKVTKDMTHKKTSFLISLTNLAKLEKFDEAHGGRIKGEFINNLLEEAFLELEQDPTWNKILTANLDKTIDRLSRRR